MYSNEDIQEMLDVINDSDLVKSEYKAKLNDMSERGYISERDRSAILDCIDEGYFERFDRYDSDVCETFITLYEGLMAQYEQEI